MYKLVGCILSTLALCSCAKSEQNNVDTSECHTHRTMVTVPKQLRAEKNQRNYCEKSLTVKQENKRLLISYQSGLKSRILAAINESHLPVIYDLKNMNVVVVIVPAKETKRYIEYFQSLDEVYCVQEDSVMHLN